MTYSQTRQYNNNNEGYIYQLPSRLQCTGYFSPLFCTHPSFTTFWSFMLAPRSEFKGQSSARLPACGCVLFPRSPVRPSRSALLFSHTLPLTFSATLWCNVSASSFTFTLSLATLQTLQRWLSLEGNNKTEKTHTHTGHSLPLLPLSHTHTLPCEIKSLLGAGKHFPPLPVAFSSSLTLDADAMCASSLNWDTLEP